jgi:hypothetical protein
MSEMTWPSAARKYRNVRRAATATDAGSEYDGRVYDSKAEARHAAALDLQKRAGLIRGWLPQVSLPIPEIKRRLQVDFLVVRLDGTFALQDVKGMRPTRDWQIKRELIEKALGVPVDIVSRTRG